MCWRSLNPEDTKLLKSDNKIVYKILSVRKKGGKLYASIFFNYEYYLNKEQSITININIIKRPEFLDTCKAPKYLELKRDVYIVENGYHSYNNLAKAIRNLVSYNNCPFEAEVFRVFKCLIPKVTKYIINESDEVVSENIIILNEI